MSRAINHLNDPFFNSEDRESLSSELAPNQKSKKMLHRCHQEERIIKKRSGAREERDVQPGSNPGSVGLSVVLIAVPEEHWKTKKPASTPILLPLASRIAIFENGLELRGRTPLAEKPCRSFSSGQRRQLYEHESPGETALLTSYLLGSSEGGTNSPPLT